MDPVERQRYSEGEYLASELASDEKHEFRDGRIVAMSGARFRHNLIATNTARALGNRLGSKGCMVVQSDQRVHVPATKLYTYPDVVVVCGRPEIHARDGMSLLNPRLLVEVLSPSSEAYDRGAKFDHYRRIPSLIEYVLVWQAERRVEHRLRVEVGQWLLTETAGDGTVKLPGLGVELSLGEIYEGVDQLPEDPEPTSAPE